MVDVFISYSRADEEKVRLLAQKIEAEGYEVWWDAELPPHKSYGEVIEEKVAACKAAIVVWSETAGQSEWVRAEADLARNAKKLIQTALGDIMPPLPFNQIQFADIGDWQGEDDHSGWRKVKASLLELCGEREAVVAGALAGGAITAPPLAPPVPPPPAPPEPEAASGPPPGSLEYHRAESGSAPKWPIFAGVGVGAVGLLGAGALLLDTGGGDYESYDEDIEPSSLADMSKVEAESAPAEASPPPAEPTASAAPAAPSFTGGSQSFSGSLNVGQSQNFNVGLNAGTSYMLVAECDMDCSDIDMWIYDENGNLIDEDVLDDDVPVLEVTPIRSAEFLVRIEMFACSVEPCGFQIAVQPM